MERADMNAIQILHNLNQIKVLQMFFIVAVAWVAIAVIERFFPWLAERLPSRLRLYILPSVPIIRLLIIVAAVARISPLFIQPTLQNLVAILSAAGLAIGFAFKDYISSVAAGIIAVYERPYRPGDWVEINGTYGEVKSLDLRKLMMLTPDDTMVTIPHSNIWSTSIHNANDGQRTLLCVADFYLHPQHDAALVRRKLHDVALTSPYLDFDRRITVIVHEQPWGTHYRLKAYPVDARDQFQFISDLTVRGKAALTKLGAGWAATLPVPAGKPAD